MVVTSMMAAMICSLSSLRIPGEKRLTLWSRFEGRARKQARRRLHLWKRSTQQQYHDIAREFGSLKYSRGYFNPNVADKEKENAMKFRRTVYDHEDWRRHRSTTRHMRHLLSIPTSRVEYAIWPPLLSLTSIAAITTGYNEAVMAQALPHWLSVLHLSTLPLSFTALSLSLLLVFRTNSSYTRFDEERKAWSTTQTRTRDMVH